MESLAPLSRTSRWCRSRRDTLLAGALIALAGLATYANSLSCPMILDDGLAIERNATIRSLWPPWRPLLPPCDRSAVDRRPITNLSLACNYAQIGRAHV